MRWRMLVVVAGSAMIAVACAQSDAGITTSVKSQLAADDAVKARRIDVDTRDRVVTLRGEVRSAEEEARALQIARSTNGVTNVIDELTVVTEPEAAPTTGAAPGAGALMTDTTITAAVKGKLLADRDTSGLRIDVSTTNNVVTLTGTVKTQAEKNEALEIARQTEGVTSVTDRLTIEPPR